jgi:hypothetical protein
VWPLLVELRRPGFAYWISRAASERLLHMRKWLSAIASGAIDFTPVGGRVVIMRVIAMLAT